MVSVSLKKVEIAFFIFTLILIIVVATVPLPENMEYVVEYIPDAVRGLTTLASVLIGFIGFCMTYLYSTEDKKIREILKNRLPWIVIIIGVGLVTVAGAYSELVLGQLVSSYKRTLIGVIIIIMLFLDTFLLLASLLSEEKEL